MGVRVGVHAQVWLIQVLLSSCTASNSSGWRRYALSFLDCIDRPPALFLGSASSHKHVRNLLPEALGLEDRGPGESRHYREEACPCH